VNRLRVRSNIVQSIVVGPDRDWAANMEVALHRIQQPYILYFQEDYFLKQSALRPGESAWNMEARASERTRDLLALSYIGQDNVPIPYLMSAISRRLWTPEAIALCARADVRIRPHFRLEHSDVPWRRRVRRGVGRIRLALALAAARRQIIDLDGPST